MRGERGYGNDDAAGWDGEVTQRGLAAVVDALDIALDAEYLAATDGACALAAADVVARLACGRGERAVYCEGVVAWVEANAVASPAGLVAKAVESVDACRGAESESAELWSQDAELFREWAATVADVQTRLGA